MKLTALILLFLFTLAQVKTQQHQDDVDPLLEQGCSSFCLSNRGYAIFGANYDLVKDKCDGLVIVNKRNVEKSFHELDSIGNHARWISKYGNVTFNFVASQTAWAGMNEAGLVLYSMRLDEGSQAPKPDERIWISAHYWLQYMLDNFSTIEEVMASDSTVRIVSSGRIPHYLVSDRYGNCVAIEFIGGKTVMHSGRDLPVRILANTAYASSVEEWKRVALLRKDRKPIPPAGTSSRGRFLRAVERVLAYRPTEPDSAVVIAFDILKDINRANANWSIVFDTKNLKIYFKTIVHPPIRSIDFHKLDFTCRSPIRLIDINEKLSGDITEKLEEYSFRYHFEHALRAARHYGLQMGPEELKRYIQNIEAFRCVESR